MVDSTKVVEELALARCVAELISDKAYEHHSGNVLSILQDIAKETSIENHERIVKVAENIEKLFLAFGAAQYIREYDSLIGVE